MGATVAVNDSLTQPTNGPDLADISEFFKLRFQYDRDPDDDIVMWSDMRKSEIAGGVELQLQGAGSAHIGIGSDGGTPAKIRFNASGRGAVSNIGVEIFNVSAAAGQPGEAGPPGPGGGPPGPPGAMGDPGIDTQVLTEAEYTAIVTKVSDRFYFTT